MTLHWKNTANLKSTALMVAMDCLEWVNTEQPPPPPPPPPVHYYN
jgi:hypothetical protein